MIKACVVLKSDVTYISIHNISSIHQYTHKTKTREETKKQNKTAFRCESEKNNANYVIMDRAASQRQKIEIEIDRNIDKNYCINTNIICLFFNE